PGLEVEQFPRPSEPGEMTAAGKGVVEQHPCAFTVDDAELTQYRQASHRLQHRARLGLEHGHECGADPALSLAVESEPGESSGQRPAHERLGEPAGAAHLRAHPHEKLDEIGIPERFANRYAGPPSEQECLLLAKPLVC